MPVAFSSCLFLIFWWCISIFHFFTSYVYMCMCAHFFMPYVSMIMCVCFLRLNPGSKPSASTHWAIPPSLVIYFLDKLNSVFKAQACWFCHPDPLCFYCTFFFFALVLRKRILFDWILGMPCKNYWGPRSYDFPSERSFSLWQSITVGDSKDRWPCDVLT